MNRAQAMAALPPQSEVLRMNAAELLGLLADMIEKGWVHPNPPAIVPDSRRLLLRYYEALEWPEEKPVRRRPQHPVEEGVFGHTSFVIHKDKNSKSWKIKVPKGDKEIPLCAVAWRCAFDPSELQALTNPVPLLNALDACLTLAPLTLEEENELRRLNPQLPAKTLVPRDSTLWTSEKKPQRMRKTHEASQSIEDELCLERTVMD